MTTAPDAPTIHYGTPLSHSCPIFSPGVPRQIRTVGHPLSHISEKCPIAQIGMGCRYESALIGERVPQVFPPVAAS